MWQTESLISSGTWGGADGHLVYDAIEPNLFGVDPLFVDEAGGDLTLAPDSPAFAMDGFAPIPFAEIGIQPEGWK